jgi:hypothetical protein
MPLRLAKFRHSGVRTNATQKARIPIRSNEYIGNYAFCEIVCRLVTNFLSGLEDRMISGRKSLPIRSKGSAFSCIRLSKISFDKISAHDFRGVPTKELATYGDSRCVL